MNYSVNINSLTIRIISNFLVFFGIVSPWLVFLPSESMRVISFSCLIIVHLLFFYKRLLNKRHTEFVVLFILIFGFLLIESHQFLYEGNFAFLRFIIMICFGFIFSYCTYQRSDYFFPALSFACIFLFTAWILQSFNIDLYVMPDGTPTSRRGGPRFLPFARVWLFSSPKEMSILFGVLLIYFSSLYKLAISASYNIKNIKKGIVKSSYIAILTLISFFMVIAAQTLSTYIFIVFHFIFLFQSLINNNKLRIICNCLTPFFIMVGLFFWGNIAGNLGTVYIGSVNIIKDSLINGIAEQISSAVMIGPGIGFFDTSTSLSRDGLRFVERIEDSSLFLRLIFEVGLIPVLAFVLFIIIRFKEGFKYVLYVAVASLPLGHYHTAYILGILVGSLVMLPKNKCNDVNVISSPSVVGVFGAGSPSSILKQS